MRVLMVSERWFPSVGGGEVHLLHLTRGLAARGVEVDLVCRDLHGPGPRLEGDGLAVHRVGSPAPFENPLERALYPPRLLERVGTLPRPDLIHVHCPLGSFPAAWLRSRLRRPLVRTLHGVYAGRWTALHGWTPKALAFALLEGLSLALPYDALISVDRGGLPRGGVAGRRARWIPNGVDCAPFDDLEVAKAEPFTFLFVGRLVPQKGLPVLLEAARRLRDDGAAFRVEVVGDGPDGPRLRARAHGLDVVAFRGNVDAEALRGSYGRAGAFVLPSRWEGLPLSLLEAWAARLPVVATQVGGIPEVAIDGENALLVPPGDPEALARAMRVLLEDGGLRERLGAAGRQTVEAGFTWERTVRETLRVYEGCLRRA